MTRLTRARQYVNGRVRKWWYFGTRRLRQWWAGARKRVFGVGKRRAKQTQVVRERQQKPQQFYAEKFTTPESVTLDTIGVVQSPYKERFGTPRQATVWEQSLGNRPQETEIHLKKGKDYQKALQGLDGVCAAGTPSLLRPHPLLLKLPLPPCTTPAESLVLRSRIALIDGP